MISGSNFVMAILLARQSSPQEYGAYALAFEVFLFVALLYGALILEPLSVFGASVFRHSLSSYLKALLKTHAAIGAIILAAGGLFAWVIHYVTPGEGLSPALIGVAVASPCILLFWLVRRVFYVTLNPKEAVLGGLVYLIIILVGLIIVYRLGLLSPLLAFLLMAAGAAITAPAMLARLKLVPESSSILPIATLDVARSHWRYGRWALASSTAIWFSTAVCYPLLASFHNLADAGAMKALMNLTSPIGQVYAALSLLFLPYAAKVHHEQGSEGSQRLVWKLAALYTGGTCLYWIAILVLRGPLVHHLYGGKYSEIAGLLPWVALGSILRISATAQAVTLRAANVPSRVFYAYATSGVTALLVGVPCIWGFGLRGAVFSFVLSGALALLISVAMVQRTSPAPTLT